MRFSRELQQYSFDVAAVGDPATGATLAMRGACDAVVFDLPATQRALHAISEVNAARPRLPIIALAHIDDVAVRVQALRAGASDCLTTPVPVEELAARIRAQLRLREHAQRTRLHGAGVQLDLFTRKVTFEGRPIRLSETEFRLLAHLLQAAGRVRSRAEILEAVWGYPLDPMTGNLVEVYIGYLRQKLSRSRRRSPILTVRCAGYRLVER